MIAQHTSITLVMQITNQLQIVTYQGGITWLLTHKPHQ